MQFDNATAHYHYGPAARRQAVLMLVLAVIALGLLLGVGVAQWSTLMAWTRIFGVVLVIVVLFTVRSQLTRLRFDLHLTADAAEVRAPLLRRHIPWNTVAEARRIRTPQLGREPRWACALVVHGRRGSGVPIFLFDNQLAGADDAWARIVAATPRAIHTNGGNKT